MIYRARKAASIPMLKVKVCISSPHSSVTGASKLWPAGQIWHTGKAFPIMNGIDHSIAQPLHCTAHQLAGLLWAFMSQKALQQDARHRCKHPERSHQSISWKMEQLHNRKICTMQDREGFPCTQQCFPALKKKSAH